MAQHPEQRRLIRLAASYNKKAAKYGVPGIIGPTDLARKPQVCFYCGVGLEVGQGTFDHRVAFDTGGTNQPDNIVRSCLTCNRTKFTKTPEEFAVAQRLMVSCEVCGRTFKPRWGEWKAGRARVCSRSCAAKKRWQIAQ